MESKTEMGSGSPKLMCESSTHTHTGNKAQTIPPKLAQSLHLLHGHSEDRRPSQCMSPNSDARCERLWKKGRHIAFRATGIVCLPWLPQVRHSMGSAKGEAPQTKRPPNSSEAREPGHLHTLGKRFCQRLGQGRLWKGPLLYKASAAEAKTSASTLEPRIWSCNHSLSGSTCPGGPLKHSDAFMRKWLLGSRHICGARSCLSQTDKYHSADVAVWQYSTWLVTSWMSEEHIHQAPWKQCHCQNPFLKMLCCCTQCTQRAWPRSATRGPDLCEPERIWTCTCSHM